MNSTYKPSKKARQNLLLKLVSRSFDIVYSSLDWFGSGIINAGVGIWKAIPFRLKKSKLKEVKSLAIIPTESNKNSQLVVFQKKSTNPIVLVKNNLKQKTQKIANFILIPSSDQKKPIEGELVKALQSINLTNQKILVQISKKNSFLQLVLIAILIALVANTSVLFFNRTPTTSQAQQVQNQEQDITNKVQVSDQNKPGLRILDSFLNTNVVAEIGQSLKVEKDKITIGNVSNCQTPIPPPFENGCDLIILPFGMGINSRGTFFKSINFEGRIEGKNQIKLTKKNFENGNISPEIGKVDGLSATKRIRLPENFSLVEGLQLKFWNVEGGLEITKISIEYASVDNLSQVSGKIKNWTQGQKQFAEIYADWNENRAFEPRSDQRWDCKANFSGVKPVVIDEDGSFVIFRDDSCFVDVKPDSWFIDEQKSVLPSGDWLLVLNGAEKIYHFKTDTQTPKIVLEL